MNREKETAIHLSNPTTGERGNYANSRKLRVELEGKDSKIANLTAERDALREGERWATLGIATHGPQLISTSNWSRSAEIPAGGSLVEYVDDMREKLGSRREAHSRTRRL